MKKSKYDIIINVLCLLALVGTMIYLALNWEHFPDKVPMHHNFAGEVDRWGSKGELLILPIIAWILYFVILAVEHFPQMWNAGVDVTEANKERVYRILKNMLITVKLILVIAFVYLTISATLSLSLPTWFLPVFLIILFGNISFWIVKLVRAK